MQEDYDSEEELLVGGGGQGTPRITTGRLRSESKVSER